MLAPTVYHYWYVRIQQWAMRWGSGRGVRTLISAVRLRRAENSAKKRPEFAVIRASEGLGRWCTLKVIYHGLGKILILSRMLRLEDSGFLGWHSV